MREILQDRADRLIRPPAEAVGLDLPPRTAAPADEQPAPPPADTPAAQDLERSTADDPYNNPQAPVRNEGGEAGGVSVKNRKKAPSRSHRGEE